MRKIPKCLYGYFCSITRMKRRVIMDITTIIYYNLVNNKENCIYGGFSAIYTFA